MLRRPSVRSILTTVAAAAVLVGGADLASYAATGNPLILGHSNSAGKTTALRNAGRGPALSLNNIKSAPPLVVNSSKQVKHLNASMVGGMTAGQLNPQLTTYRLGQSGSTLSAGQHYFTAPAPAGDVQVTITGIWTSTVNTDSIQCIVVDKKLLTDNTNITLIYALTSKTLDTSTDQNNINTTQYVHIPKHRTLVFGCLTSGDTGTIQVAQPITFSFQKISPTVKHATPTTLTKHGPMRRLVGR